MLIFMFFNIASPPMNFISGAGGRSRFVDQHL